jgi:DNA polymerase-3 subunit gamma/tau
VASVTAVTHVDLIAEPGDEGTDPAVAVAVASATATETADVAELDLDSFSTLWPAVVQSLQDDHPMIAALLQEARPAGCDGRQVTLAWGESHAFFKRKVDDPVNREHVLGAIRAVTGASLRLTLELCDDEEARVQSPAQPAVSEDELIARFMAEFDAQEIPPEPSKES